MRNARRIVNGTFAVGLQWRAGVKLPLVERHERDESGGLVRDVLLGVSEAAERGDGEQMFVKFCELRDELRKNQGKDVESLFDVICQLCILMLEMKMDDVVFGLVFEVLELSKAWKPFAELTGARLMNLLKMHTEFTPAVFMASHVVRTSAAVSKELADSGLVEKVIEHVGDECYEAAKLTFLRRFLSKCDQVEMETITLALSYVSRFRSSNTDLVILWSKAVTKAIDNVSWATRWLVQHDFFSILAKMLDEDHMVRVCLDIFAVASGCGDHGDDIDSQLYPIPALEGLLLKYGGDDGISSLIVTIFVNFFFNTRRQVCPELVSAVTTMINQFLLSGSFRQKVRVIDVIHNICPNKELVSAVMNAEFIQEYLTDIAEFDLLSEHPRYFYSLKSYVELGKTLSGVDFDPLVKYLTEASHKLPGDGPQRCEFILCLINSS